MIRQQTFDRLSHIAGNWTGLGFPPLEWMIEKIVQLCGCEMDSVAASKKLEKLDIKEVIVQATQNSRSDKAPLINDFKGDGLIAAEVSLGRACAKQGEANNRVFIGQGRVGHGPDENLAGIIKTYLSELTSQ